VKFTPLVTGVFASLWPAHFFQIVTWLEIKNISHYSWTGCGREFPCHVIIDDQARRIIDNDDLARRIGEEVAKKFKR
jgi:hypothetical protein